MPAPEPGWYPVEGRWRYFDGKRLTDETPPTHAPVLATPTSLESAASVPSEKGWYVNPDDPWTERWWNGDRWSSSVRTARVAPPPEPPATPSVPTPVAAQRAGHWRFMTWVFLAFNALMAVWLIAGVNAASNSECSPGISISACEAGNDVGTAIGAGIILFFWFIGFVVLGLLWFMTRTRGRPCPVCGHGVKIGVTLCGSCGHDFALAVRTQMASD